MTVLAVECSACQTSFPVDPGKVPAGGVRARCSVCGGIFQVEDPALDLTPEFEPLEPTADRLGTASFPEAGPDPEYSPEPWSGVAESEEVVEAETGVVEDVWAPEDVSSVEEGPVGEAAAVEESSADVVTPEQPTSVAEPTSMEAPTSMDEPTVAEEPTAVEEPGEATWSTDASVGFEEWDVEVVPEDGLSGGPETAEEAEAEAEPEVEVEAEPEPTPTAAREDVWTVETEAEWTVEEEAPGAEPAQPETAELEAAQPEVTEAETTQPETGEAEPAPLPGGFQFGKRDPHEKARRLARVLVSDIITYNPERYLRALESDTLKEDFDEEIQKSWTEYVEQIGSEIAHESSYWRDALNDLLARGREVF